LSAGVYRIVNNVTGAVYVGYSQNLSNRFDNYRYNSVKSQPLIHSSIKEYGFSAHTFSVLYDYEEVKPSVFELKQLESIFIRYYKYWKGCIMLNSNEGGGGSSKWSKNRKENYSKKRRGYKKRGVLQYGLNGKFVRRWSSISEVSNALNLNYNRLIICLKENTNRISVGGFQWRYDNTVEEAKIEQLTLDGEPIQIWTNAAEFLRTINKSGACATVILGVCRGQERTRSNGYTFKYHSAYGYKWRFVHSNNDDSMQYIDIPAYDDTSKQQRPILQYDIDGNFLKEWASVTVVHNELKIPLHNIRITIDSKYPRYNKQNSVFKYQWRYKLDDDFPKKIDPLDLPCIAQYSLSGELIKIWRSTTQIEQEIGIPKKNLNQYFYGRCKKSNGFQWKRHNKTSDVLQVIDNVCKIKEEKKKIKWLQYNMNGEFLKAWDRLIDIENELGVNSQSISLCTKGKLKRAGQYQWRVGEVFEVMEDIKPMWIISQYGRNGEFIRDWNGLKEITEHTEYRQSPISSCVSGKKPQAYGYVWKYK